MPPVAFRILFPRNDNTFPIVSVSKGAQNSIMPAGKAMRQHKGSLICAQLRIRYSHIVVVILYSPFVFIPAPACTDVCWKRVGEGISTSELGSCIGAVFPRTRADGNIGTRIWAIASLVGATLWIARRLRNLSQKVRAVYTMVETRIAHKLFLGSGVHPNRHSVHRRSISSLL